MNKKKYKVIALHCYPDCDMVPRCKFCYKSGCSGKTLDKSFWYQLTEYIPNLTDQCAIGGGETFFNPGFVATMAKKLKSKGVIVNATTNGKNLMKMSDKTLIKTIKDFAMISISFDDEKIKTIEDLEAYKKLVERIKRLTKCEVGSNLLINKNLFKSKGVPFYKLVRYLFDIVKVDRIFSLYPKNYEFVDIVPNKLIYESLSIKYPKFYVDDLSLKILEEGYTGWKKPCHFGKDILSINWTGACCGCSFDSDSKSLLTLNEPLDLLKLKGIKIEPRYSCPYLKCAAMD